MKNIIDLTNSHRAFLNSLPATPIKKVLIKLLVAIPIGSMLVIFLIGALGSLIDNIQSTNFRIFLGTAAQGVPLLVIIVLLFHKGSLRELPKKLFPKTANKSFLPMVLSLIGLFVPLMVIILVFAVNNPQPSTYSSEIVNAFDQKITVDYLVKSLAVLVMYLILAAIEEFIFRFTIFRFLRRKGLIPSLIISSILFSFIHKSIGLPFAFIAGTVFALHYEYTNSFAKTVLLHGLHNYLSVYNAMYIAYILSK